jgi:hypothetical protein
MISSRTKKTHFQTNFLPDFYFSLTFTAYNVYRTEGKHCGVRQYPPHWCMPKPTVLEALGSPDPRASFFFAF